MELPLLKTSFRMFFLLSLFFRVIFLPEVVFFSPYSAAMLLSVTYFFDLLVSV